MSTPDPSEYMDDSLNDYTSNNSFEHEATDMSSSSEREDVVEVSAHKEYDSYSHMVDVAAKSNGQMLSLHHNIVEGIPVFAFSDGHVWIGDTKHGVQIREVRNFDVVKNSIQILIDLTLTTGTIAMRCMTIVDNEVWVGYCNGDINVFDRNNLDKPPKEITSSSSKTSIDCITHSSGIIWTGSADWELRARRQSNGSSIKSLPDGHRDWIRSILIVGDNLWSAGDDSLICLWDAETGEKVRTIELKTKHGIKVKCTVLCVVGSTVWGGCADGFIRMWNFNGDYIRRFKAHKGAVSALVCAGAHVWSGGLDKIVRIWEREATNLIETIPVTFPVLTMAMHGTQVYLGGRSVVQVRMTSGLLEWLRQHYRKLDMDYVKVLQVYESLLEKYEAAEPEKMHEIIENMRQDKETKEAELEDVLKQFNQIQGEMEALIEEKNAAIARLKELEDAHIQKDRELATGKAELEGHKTEIEGHKKELEGHKKELEGHKKELEGHKKSLAQSEATIAEHVAKISDYEEKIKQQGTEKQGFTDQQAALQAKIDEMQTKIDNLQSQLSQAQEALNQAEEHGAKTSGDRDKQGSLIQDLTAQVANLEKEKQGLQTQERMLVEVVAVTENKLKGTEEKLKEERDKLKAVEDKLKAAEEKIKGHKDNQVTQDREILRLHSDVRDRDQTIHNLNVNHGKESLAAKSGHQSPVAGYASKPPFVEKCALFVIFVLCSCLILAFLFFLFLHLTSTPHSAYDTLWPH